MSLGIGTGAWYRARLAQGIAGNWCNWRTACMFGQVVRVGMEKERMANSETQRFSGIRLWEA